MYDMIRTHNCSLTEPKGQSDVDCVLKIREGKRLLYCKLEVSVVHSSLQMQPKTEDCHCEIDVHWLQEQVIPNSEQNSLLVEGNGISRNKQNDK